MAILILSSYFKLLSLVISNFKPPPPPLTHTAENAASRLLEKHSIETLDSCLWFWHLLAVSCWTNCFLWGIFCICRLGRYYQCQLLDESNHPDSDKNIINKYWLLNLFISRNWKWNHFTSQLLSTASLKLFIFLFIVSFHCSVIIPSLGSFPAVLCLHEVLVLSFILPISSNFIFFLHVRSFPLTFRPW